MKVVFFHLCLLLSLSSRAQPLTGYQPLDKSQPVVFGGSYLVFKGDTLRLGPKAFFIDGQLSDAEAAKFPYVFNTVNKAAKQLTNGTEAAPMVLYLAPWVYWIDDPDDPAIRVPKEGSTPYGLEIACEWLKFQGLTDKPENVVLACNRGQTIGAQGNFTMFRFSGQGTRSENLTFGNYCNVDLVYPLNAGLSRTKRASAIVQAQLIHCNGDKIVARNTRFISRLNLCPFVGGKRVLFDRCHFESTDDALCGTGVYLNSTLDFYSSKPFYRTTGTGAVFLNCDIRSFSGDKQYFTKAGGQVAVVDSRFTAPVANYWGWQDVVPRESRNYQYNVRLNNKPLFIGRADPAATVDLDGKALSDAYRFLSGGRVVYNTYNLLKGNDDWDPMNIKPLVLAAAKEAKKTYTDIPVQLVVLPAKAAVETKKDSVVLSAKAMRFGHYPGGGGPIRWAVASADRSFVRLRRSGDGETCTVVPTNGTDKAKQVVVLASTPAGLEGASLVTVAPSILEAPAFTVLPAISPAKNGKVSVVYTLATKYGDQSRVTWYRCTDAQGSNPVEVAVSRFDTPPRDYLLSAGDAGYHLAVSVEPKHLRSKAGQAVRFVTKQAVAATEIKASAAFLVTDFRNLSVRNQPKILPGFWTWDHFTPKEADPKNSVDRTRDAWYFGEGLDGAANMVGLLQGRSASMYYTPVGDRFGDMKLVLTVAPFKTAGQGFSVAHLYMDVLVKYDAKTRSGYGLRLIRTTKHHDAVDCLLLKYENGQAQAIGEPLTTAAFKTLCTITVEVKGKKLVAQVSTSAPAQQGASTVRKEVKLEGSISSNALGGLGIEYNGGSPTLVKELRAEWMQE